MLFFLILLLLLRVHGDINMPQFSTQAVPWTGITSTLEKCRLDWERAPLKSAAHMFLCPWWASASPQWGFGSSRGLWGTRWFWAQRSEWVATVRGKAGGKNQSSVLFPPSISASAGIITVWSSFTHPDPERAGCANPDLSTTLLHPWQGQVSIPDPINGADRSGSLSEWGRLNSIELL